MCIGLEHCGCAQVMLNWGYHKECPGDAFDCFETEVTSMLTERIQYAAWTSALDMR